MFKPTDVKTPVIDNVLTVIRLAPEQMEEGRQALAVIVDNVQQPETPDATEERLSYDPVALIDAYIAKLDAKLSEQLSEIMHHPAFSSLEGSWRGLEYLVNQADTSATLKIKALDVSKEELLSDLSGDIKQSSLYRLVYTEEYGQLGGNPYAALIGDYAFDHSNDSLKVLKGIAKVAAAAHAPFLTAAAPSLFNLNSFTDLWRLQEGVYGVFEGAKYAGWKSFRASEESRYVVMTLPRVMARLPYGSETVRVNEFNFEENVDPDDQGAFTWMNAAYALGARFADAFSEYGWCVNFRGVENGGMVKDLPVYTYVSDHGHIEMKCPTEVTISDRLEKELSDNGFLSLVHKKSEDCAVFMSGQTVQQPKKYNEPAATESADLSAKLPYLMAVSRIAHYLKVILRDKIASGMEREDAERFLNTWIADYVTADPNATKEARARQPLRDAKIEVKAIPGSPGCYNAVAYLRPHFQLESINVSLRLVAEVPESSGR